MENHGVETEPCGVGWRRLGGEGVLEGVGGDSHGEEGAPLGKDIGLEVEDDRDKGADVLDGRGLRPEVGVGVGLRRWRHGRGEGVGATAANGGWRLEEGEGGAAEFGLGSKV